MLGAFAAEQPRREFDTRRVFDALMALALLIPALPVMGLIYVLHLLCMHDGGPFLCRGERLGRYRTPFTILKIRTLPLSAERRLGPNPCGSDSDLVVGLGRFLRATRLDELPQLFNILKGDMGFIGPRPERRAGYETKIRNCPGHSNERFMVRPGLIGRSQFHTRHFPARRLGVLMGSQAA
jgi:lipopolysaccharide/colanic/teichoic acid biosynthesis glycosyltransferase